MTTTAPPGFSAHGEQSRRAPEHASGWTPKQLVRHPHCMVATANPAATQAGLQVLAQGGHAVDAAIAIQAMLGLTEPQSSGLGGGGYALVYDAQSQQVFAYDGRETAPLQLPAPLRSDCTVDELGASPASFGVPGMPALLALLHQRHGRRPWSGLFSAAGDAAENGFDVSNRMAIQIAAEANNLTQAAAREYLLAQALPAYQNQVPLKNPAYAALLQEFATRGAHTFYQGRAARDMLAAVLSHQGQGPASTLTLQDFSRYEVRPHTPLTVRYRGHLLHGVAASSAGGLMALQMLGMLEAFDLPPLSTAAAHLQTQASRLAFADRFRHAGDPDFSAFDHSLFLNADYLRARAELINLNRDMGLAPAGLPQGLRAADPRGDGVSVDFPSTTHFSVVDAQGNAVAMTSSIGMAFGCRLMACGTFLNDQLVAFDLDSWHVPRAGSTSARPNGIEGGKRPLSAMAPTIVFDASNQLRMLTGSPGAAAIVGYTVKSILGVIDWGLDVQQAVDLPNVINRNGVTELEKNTSAEQLKEALEAMGHTVAVNHQTSGVHAIVKDGADWTAGCDPRRDGWAMGA
ncbi:MAG: gamma-glutamyltransferase family protein [Rhizobacter sp.]